jgi:hypothetical protein
MKLRANIPAAPTESPNSRVFMALIVITGTWPM